ncbi:MAG: phage holin family protein [Alphaproteobacteria bacterium]|nr:MAG: phage holin family protein [Alphaproteobacteria bacterium]
MDARVGNPTEEPSIGELFGQLAEDGKTLLRSEVGLYREIALYRVGKAKFGVAALLGAALLANTALIVIFVGIAMGLAKWIGPVGGGFASAAIALVIAFVLVRWGLPKLQALGGDTEEKAALTAAERRP